jgi:hypothetical protein
MVTAQLEMMKMPQGNRRNWSMETEGGTMGTSFKEQIFDPISVVV